MQESEFVSRLRSAASARHERYFPALWTVADNGGHASFKVVFFTRFSMIFWYSTHWSFERANNPRLFTRFIGTTICTWGFFITSKYHPSPEKTKLGWVIYPKNIHKKHSPQIPVQSIQSNQHGFVGKHPQIWCLIIFLLISMAIFGVPDQVSQDSFRWGRAVRTTDATAALPGMAHGFSPQWICAGRLSTSETSCTSRWDFWSVFTQKTHSQHPKKSPKRMCRWFLWVSC